MCGFAWLRDDAYARACVLARVANALLACMAPAVSDMYLTGASCVLVCGRQGTPGMVGGGWDNSSPMLLDAQI